MNREKSARARTVIAFSLVALGILLKFLVEEIFYSLSVIIPGVRLNLLVIGIQLLLIGGGFHLLIKGRDLKMLLLVSSSILSLLFLEVSCRLYLFGWDALSIAKVNSVHPFGFAGFIQPSTHPGILYELKPNLSAYFKMAVLKTNNQGLRDRDYSIDKPPRTFRVAVIGDSFSMPSGVEIEEAYHSLVEERLNEERRGLTYEFINFSGSGGSLRSYVAVATQKAVKYSPDLILIGFCPANDHKIYPSVIRESAFRRKKTYPFFFQFFSKQLFKSYLGALLRSDIAISQEEIDYMKGEFSQLHAFREETNTAVAVVYLNNAPVEPEKTKIVEDIVTAQGFSFLDTSSSFVGTNPRDYSIYAPLDVHPNGRANKIFGDRVYEFLIERELVPEPRERNADE